MEQPENYTVPGDEFVMLAGNYDWSGTTAIRGTSINPLVFRPIRSQYIAGQYATIRGQVTFQGGGYLTFRNIHVTGIDRERLNPAVSVNRGGIDLLAPEIHFINPIVYDLNTVGISSWGSAVGSIMYGRVGYNCGWSEGGAFNVDGTRDEGAAASGNHSYTSYVQSVTDGVQRLFRHCIDFNGFKNINTFHQSGAHMYDIAVQQSAFYGRRLNFGDSDAQHRTLVDGCHIEGILALAMGVDSDNLECNNNVIASTASISPAVVPLELAGWISGNVHANTVVNTNNAQLVNHTRPDDNLFHLDFNNNSYHDTDNSVLVVDNGVSSYTWAQWQALGRDLAGSQSSSIPAANTTHVYLNEYKTADDPRVGIVVIWNWEGALNQNADLSSLNMVAGQDYVIKNAFNYFAAGEQQAYESDGDDSSVAITLSGLTIATCAGTWNGVPIVEPLEPAPSYLRAFVIEESS